VRIVAIPTIRPHPLPAEYELPANTASWKLEAGRAMLLIHDMQEYFLRAFPAGQSPVTELVDNTVALRRRCAELGIPVGYTAQPGSMTDAERGLLRDFWGPGMTTSEQDRAVVAPLAPGPDDLRFVKWRYSAFQRSDLLERMRGLGRDQLIVCGVYAHVGCLMTANDAYANDIETFFVADATADFTPEYHRLALTYAASRCAMVVSTESALAMLAGERVGP
jgi:isochorismate hydrolase